jgi:hypothetical protein
MIVNRPPAAAVEAVAGEVGVDDAADRLAAVVDARPSVPRSAPGTSMVV